MTYWFSTWVEGFSKATGQLSGLTRDQVLDETGEIERWAARADNGQWKFERSDVYEVWRILEAIEHSSLAVESGIRWIHSFDYKDSDAWSELGPMVGVPDEELTKELPELGAVARSHGTQVEVHDFVDLCNLRSRNGRQLYSVDTHGDNYLYVALTPAACEFAVRGQLFEVARPFERTRLVGREHAREARVLPPVMSSAGRQTATLLAMLFAVGAVVYAIVALARSKTLGAVALVILLVIGFEFGKSALLRHLDAAYATTFPRLMRALHFIART